MDAGQRGHGADQDVERLVAVQTAEREDQRGGGRQAECRRGGVRHVGGEVRQVVQPRGRPALGGNPIDDGARVADQVVAVAEIPQVVVAAEAAGQDPVALWREARGAAHPGDRDAGREMAEGGSEAGAGQQVERAAEAKLQRDQASAGQAVGPGGVAADDRQDGVAGMRERDGETLEEQLGAASGRSGHDLRDVHAVEAAVVGPGCSMHPLPGLPRSRERGC